MSMDDLIRRGDLFVSKDWYDCTCAAQVILKAPAVDAVPVVRCKDCAVPHNRWTGCPKMNGTVMPPDGFCSYGERKE